MAKLSKTAAAKGLQIQKEKIQGLTYTADTDAFIKEWSIDTATLLEMIYGADSAYLVEFKNIHYLPIFITSYTSINMMEEHFKRGVAKADELLNRMIKEQSV